MRKMMLTEKYNHEKTFCEIFTDAPVQQDLHHRVIIAWIYFRFVPLVHQSSTGSLSRGISRSLATLLTVYSPIDHKKNGFQISTQSHWSHYSSDAQLLFKLLICKIILIKKLKYLNKNKWCKWLHSRVFPAVQIQPKRSGWPALLCVFCLCPSHRAVDTKPGLKSHSRRKSSSGLLQRSVFVVFVPASALSSTSSYSNKVSWLCFC